jgi:hypothetical protein
MAQQPQYSGAVMVRKAENAIDTRLGNFLMV